MLMNHYYAQNYAGIMWTTLTGIEVGFLPGALGDVIAVICAPATSLTSVIGIDSFGTIGISR